MNLITSYLVVGGGLVLSAAFFSVARRLARADKMEATKGAARSCSVLDSILGRARMHEDWMPDARIKGGLIYNKKKKRLETSGRLSDDSFKRVFR
jgi:hypothetical protein